MSDLQICDADSDIIFEPEKSPLRYEKYTKLKDLTIKSAKDFEEQYLFIPDKHQTSLKERNTTKGVCLIPELE